LTLRQRRVAVTGIGAISALGPNIAAYRRAVQLGQCGIAPITAVPSDRLSVRSVAEVKAFDPAAHFDERQLGRLDRVAQLALVAARQAMAGIDLSGLPPRRCGTVLAASLGQETIDSAYFALYGGNAKRLHPMTVPRSMPNASCSQLSIEFGLTGPSFAVASACASASHAIGTAFHMVRAGMLDLAIAGGSDASITVGFLKSWESLRVLSTGACRPFSRDREGLVIGEGAGMLVLEDWDHATARGADIHAEMLGFGMGADAVDLTAPDAAGAARAMREALEDAGLASRSIDYVNAHGTGTRLNDRTEVTALRDVFGPRLARLPVSSTKSMLGHCLNAAGALEAVASVVALRDGIIPPTLGFRVHDPNCDIDCVANAARPAPIRTAMSNSFAFGGLNAVLVLGKAA
jgi:nodulation protein E